MIYIVVSVLAVVLLVAAIRKIPENERGVVYRLGHRRNSAVGPGTILLIPFLDRMQRVSVEAFSVSLPPQSAITKDEIPIQLQASLDAVVKNPVHATEVRDWRIFLMSQLQELMKEQLEDLDFDRLDEVFPEWVKSIRSQLSSRANSIGVEITGLQISNLSPRTKPSA
jgi:regulator of protease activity HflC (stomatin/prohibitin superfamily)